jgi:UDP-glucose 4-epimerase
VRLVVVTGGLGFIGSHLVEALVRRGRRVRVVDNGATGWAGNLPPEIRTAVEVLSLDVRQRAGLAEAFAGASVVHHLAVECLWRSLEDPALVHEVNAGGTLAALMAAREAGVGRFVYVSSSEVYGTAVHAPMDEDHPLRPHTVYAASKLAGEQYALAMHRTWGLPVVAVRPFNVYGPRQRGSGHFPGDVYGGLIPRAARALLRGEPVPLLGGGAQRRDYTHASDAAEAIARAGEVAGLEGRIINIASGEAHSVREVVALLAELTGTPADRAAVQGPARPGDVDLLLGSAERARQLLDHRPSVSFEAGLAGYVDWLRRVLDGGGDDAVSRPQARQGGEHVGRANRQAG